MVFFVAFWVAFTAIASPVKKIALPCSIFELSFCSIPSFARFKPRWYLVSIVLSVLVFSSSSVMVGGFCVCLVLLCVAF